MSTVFDRSATPVSLPPLDEPGPASAAPVLGRGMGWRRHLTVLVALVGCLLLYLGARALALEPTVPGEWASDGIGRLRLAATEQVQLQPAVDGVLVGVQGAGEAEWMPTAALLHPSLRWQADPLWRDQQARMRERLRTSLGSGTVLLRFADGRTVAVDPVSRGYGGLGGHFWLLAGLSLVLLLAGTVILLARPHRSSALYCAAAAAQSLQLALTAAESLPGLGAALPTSLLDLPMRVSLDVVALAATWQGWHQVHRPAAGSSLDSGAWAWLALPVWWLVCSATTLLPGQGQATWLFSQVLGLAMGAGICRTMRRSARLEHNPHARVTSRLSLGVWLLFASASVVCFVWSGITPRSAMLALNVAVAWHLVFAVTLLTGPSLGRGRELARELTLLAGISAVASALDLLFVAVFSLSNFTSLALAVFAALAIYAGARQWLLSRLLDQRVLSTERAFEALYRSARDVQRQPQAYPQALADLLGQLFSPLELRPSQQSATQAEVLAGGSTMLVPLRPRGDQGDAETRAWVLRFADRGRRLFTPEDARLANRLLEQLDRAVAHDEAVERGRAEERQRIAQDLHDDIGARLLTLMYQAPTREMEDYIRHTLQDLKTLTRGLATPDQHLSHVAAEWKADLSQRLSAAHAVLDWDLDLDDDPPLSVVQWSALTRVLRELVTNALFHGQAQRVQVSIRLHACRLDIAVSDNGDGRAPESWSHGLGLGGVRKRVKLLGGHVSWREQASGGISCRLQVPEFSRPPIAPRRSRPPV